MPKFSSDRDDGRSRTEKVTVRLLPEAMKAIEAEAKLRKTTPSALVRHAIAKWFETGRQ